MLHLSSIIKNSKEFLNYISENRHLTILEKLREGSYILYAISDLSYSIVENQKVILDLRLRKH